MWLWDKKQLFLTWCTCVIGIFIVRYHVGFMHLTSCDSLFGVTMRKTLQKQTISCESLKKNLTLNFNSYKLLIYSFVYKTHTVISNIHKHSLRYNTGIYGTANFHRWFGLGFGLWCLTPLSINNISVTSWWRKPPTCRKSLTNFIT